MKLYLALTATLLVLACSGSNGNNTPSPSSPSPNQPTNIAPTAVSGSINGKPFVLGTALAWRTQGVTKEVFNIIFASQGVPFTCAGAEPKTLIHATSPASVGTYDARYGYDSSVSPGHFAFIFPKTDNSPDQMEIGVVIGQIEGTIRIDSFDSNQIHGGVYSKATRNYQGVDYNAEISGEFTAAFCP